MEAMILAAGKGTRLMPLTADKPKALVEVGGCTLLERCVDKMIRSGIRHIVINTHHFAEQIHDFVKRKQFPADIFFSDETTELLDTGGGLLAAERFFTKTTPLLMHNVDIVSRVDFAQMESEAKKQNALALLCVSQRKTSRHLLFDSEFQLCGRDNQKADLVQRIGEKEIQYSYAFSGIHLLQPQIFDLFTLKGSFSIIDQYLALSQSQIIRPFVHESKNWFDVGKIEQIKEIDKALSEMGK